MSKVTIEIVHAGHINSTGVRVLVDGELVATGTYGGEPEDNCESRDYAWVKEALATLARKLGADTSLVFTDLPHSERSPWFEAEKADTNAFYEALYRKELP